MKKITITQVEAAALRTIMDKINTTQLSIEPEFVLAENPLKNFKGNTRAILKSLSEKYGILWISPKDPNVRKIMFANNCTNITSVLQICERRGLAEVKYKDSKVGNKRFIERFKLAPLV